MATIIGRMKREAWGVHCTVKVGGRDVTAWVASNEAAAGKAALAWRGSEGEMVEQQVPLKTCRDWGVALVPASIESRVMSWHTIGTAKGVLADMQGG